MALNVISNFAANVAHRNLLMSDAAASSSLTKLSSGQRVVSAKDDAASLAIGSRLRAEVVAMRTANVNAGLAGSMLQIADGAMATISDILVRMKELAVQASSGQYSSIERGILDSEFQALSSEITRISNDTEFNGTQLIAGAGDTVVQQDGFDLAASGYAITFDTNTTTSLDAYRITFDNVSATEQKLSVENVTTGEKVTVDVTAAIDSVLAARTSPGTAGTENLASGETVDVQFTSLGITITLDDSFDRAIDSNNLAGVGTIDVTGAGAVVANDSLALDTDGGISNDALDALLALSEYNSTTGILTIGVTDNGTNSVILDAIATIQYNSDGVGANSANYDGTTAQTVTIEVGGEVLGTITADFGTSGGATTGTITIDIGEALFSQTTTVGGSSSSFNFKVGTGNQSYDSLTFTVTSSSASALGVLGTDQSGLIGITTAALAETASTAVSSAIDTLNTSRSNVGAAQNRLTFAAQNLASAIENAEAARSTLLDLDVAKEITVFTSKQILVQTGIAMLAQANQMPQNLLRLFQ